MALRTLVHVAKQPRAPPAARVAACEAILNRGWGKPSQPLTGKDEEPLQRELSALELAQWIGAVLRDARPLALEPPTIEAGHVADDSADNDR